MLKKNCTIFIVSLLLITFSYVVFNGSSAHEQRVRDVVLERNSMDYQAFFDNFDEVTLNVSTDGNVSFQGIQTIDQSIFSYIDNLSACDIEIATAPIEFDIDYRAADNVFILSARTKSYDGEIFDQIEGTPFLDGNGEINIVFNIDGEIIFLSELNAEGLIDNMFLRRLIQAAVVVAVVAVAVAVVVVAAPAVIAVATVAKPAALATGAGSIAMGGASAGAALAAGAAAAGVAMAGTAFKIAMTTAAIATFTAVAGEITYQLQAKEDAGLSREEKVLASMEKLRLQFPNDTIIFRGGSNSYYNLTPRLSDFKGLSFTTMPIFTGAVMTTQQIINETKKLNAIQDGITHVSVTPTSGDLASWIASKATANTAPHEYSMILRSIVIRV